MAITFLKDDDGDKQIPYDEAVVEGRNLVSSMKDIQFELGRIADKLEPKYEERTLERYAEEIKIDHGTLKSYRTTYRAWKDMPARPAGFSVAKALNRHPNRADIIQETPELSVKEAGKKMQEWKKEHSTGGKRRTLSTDNAIYRSKTRILRQIKDFLSETSDLRGMIWEITDLPNIDSSYLEEIVEALREASLRINTMIEIAFHKSKTDIVLDQSKDEADEALSNGEGA
jgi:hypothetical protein